MITTTDLFSCLGDVIELNLPTWNVEHAISVLSSHTGWKIYNPRTKNNRFGLSVTSLDGGYSGIPDLDSLRQYNLENGTDLHESRFRVRTSVVNDIPDLKNILDSIPNLGRCHFLRLDSGGFFPTHRDNGTQLPSPTFRIIVPLVPTGWKWIQEDRVLNLVPGRTYCINTTKEHSVFSFIDNCYMLVLNVVSTPNSIKAVTERLNVY